MAPKLEKVFTLRAFLSKEDLLPLGPIKGGPHRFAVPITHGSLEGSSIKAHLVQGGSDWILMDTTTGTAYLDVRLQGRTLEGDSIYIHYPGILKVDDATQKVLEWSPDAKTTRVEDHYFMVTPTFETSNQSLKWMEQSIFIGHGRWVVPGDGTQAVEYDIYKVVSAKSER
jgi:hypothetical protein